MSSIVGAITGGGGQGVNFQAKSADIQNPATVDQATQQYNNAQNALSQQQQFVQALQAQNGLGNQTSVFNQLQGVANGAGPNPAQAQLAQATGQTVANQAALMAGQRGAGANAGLIARQAALQGANTQQQAAGQAATLQAQQSLNALNQLGGIANTQVNQQANALQGYNSAVQGEQNQILGAIQGQNQANVANISSQNAANEGIADTVSKGQMNFVGNLTGAIGSGAQTLAGKPPAAGAAEGGEIKAYAGGGKIGQSGTKAGAWFNSNMMASPDYQSSIGSGMRQFGAGAGSLLKNAFSSAAASPASQTLSPMDVNGLETAKQSGASPMDLNGTATAIAPGQTAYAVGGKVPKMELGGTVPALFSPGEKYLDPNTAKKVAEGKASPMKDGKTVPGKPVVGGAKNSYSNDIVKANPKPGGIVIPRSVTQSKDAEEKAVAFVRDVFARKGALPRKGR